MYKIDLYTMYTFYMEEFPDVTGNCSKIRKVVEKIALLAIMKKAARLKTSPRKSRDLSLSV